MRDPSGMSIHDMFSTTPTRRWRVCSEIAPGALGHLGGRLLRRGDHEQLGVRDQLRGRDRDVAGAGRQVEQQHVEVAPEDVGEELLQGAVQHRPAPDHRGVAGGEHPDRDDLHAVRLRRQDHLVDLGRQVARRRACAARSGRRCRRRPRRPRGPCSPWPPRGSPSPTTCRRRPCPRRPRRPGSSSPGCANGITGSSASPFTVLRSSRRCSSFMTSSSTETAETPGDRRHRVGDPAGDGVLHRAAGHGQVDRDLDLAVVEDADVLDHAQLGDRTVDLGVLDTGECGADRLDRR